MGKRCAATPTCCCCCAVAVVGEAVTLRTRCLENAKACSVCGCVRAGRLSTSKVWRPGNPRTRLQHLGTPKLRGHETACTCPGRWCQCLFTRAWHSSRQAQAKLPLQLPEKNVFFEPGARQFAEQGRGSGSCGGRRSKGLPWNQGNGLLLHEATQVTQQASHKHLGYLNHKCIATSISLRGPIYVNRATQQHVPVDPRHALSRCWIVSERLDKGSRTNSVSMSSTPSGKRHA